MAQQNQQQSAVGSITIKRLRTGDSLQLTLNSTKALYQIVDENGAVDPDWTVADNQPEITPVITSMRGQSLQLASCKWYLDGNEESNVVASYSAESGVVVKGGFSLNVDDSFGTLKILVNMSTAAGIYNHVLTYKASILVGTNTTPDTVSLSRDIEVRKLSSSAYWGAISTTNGEVLGVKGTSGSIVEETTLKPILYLGKDSQPDSSFSVKWYKVIGGGGVNNDEPINGGTVSDPLQTNGNNLIVRRSGVDGVATFVAKFFKKNGNTTTEVESAYIVIKDTADALQVVLSGDSQVSTAPDASTTIRAQVYNLNTNSAVTNVTWSDPDIKEAETLQDVTIVKGTYTQSGGIQTITIFEQDMYYDGKACDLVITVEATII